MKQQIDRTLPRHVVAVHSPTLKQRGPLLNHCQLQAAYLEREREVRWLGRLGGQGNFSPSEIIAHYKQPRQIVFKLKTVSEQNRKNNRAMFTISLIQSYAVTSGRGRYIYISCAEIAFVWKCNLLISPHVRCFVGSIGWSVVWSEHYTAYSHRV